MIVGQGEMKTTEFGAMREANEGRGRFDLLPYEAIEALAKWYEEGAKKYDERNWEKGLSVKDCINRMIRHSLKAGNGWTDEDHLAAVMWNAAAAITMMKRHPECNDHIWKDENGMELKRPHSESIPEFMTKTFHIASPQYHELHRLQIGFNQILDTRVRNGSLSSAETSVLRELCGRLLDLNNVLGDKFPEELLIAVTNELETMTGPGTEAHLISDDDRLFLVKTIESGGIADLETLQSWINRRIK